MAADPAPLQGADIFDAFAQVKRLLQVYGLTNMEDWIQKQLVYGQSKDALALALRETPQFRQRFAVIDAISKYNNDNPNSPRHIPTPDEVLEYEKGATAMLRQAGLPPGFYDDQKDLQDLMVKNVSLTELQSRVQDGYLKVSQAPAEVRDAFSRFFGAQGDSALASVFLDPERSGPVLEKMVSQSQIAGSGARYGLDINQPTAGRVADLGLSQAAVDAGFGKIHELGAIFGQTVGEAAAGQQQVTAEGQGIEAMFNLDPNARQQIVKKVGQREADFAGSAGALQERQGLTGLGQANR